MTQNLKFLLVAILSVAFFTSCSDDDDKTDKDILGMWEFSQIQLQVKTNSDKATAIINQDMKLRFISSDSDFEFLENGKLRIHNSKGIIVDCTYKVADNQLIIENAGRYNYTYLVSNNGLTIFKDGTKDYTEDVLRTFSIPDPDTVVVEEAVAIRTYTKK